MSETTTTPSGEPQAGQGGSAPSTTTTVTPTQPQAGQAPTTEQGTLTEEQWKIAFGHDRFKKLGERAKKADELEAKFQTEEEERLKKQGDYQKLLENEKSARTELETKFKNSVLENSIMAEAVKQGVADVDAVIKLIDKNGIELDENFKATGIDKAVEKLLAEKPYLKSAQPASNIGANANPAGNNGGGKPKWTMSNLREKMKDHKWYMENKGEIEAARKEGRIDYSK
jgi:hypothetical protein